MFTLMSLGVSTPLKVLGLGTASVLTTIGALHVYWAARGVPQGGNVAIPEVEGRPAFQPTRLQTLAVAAALFTGTTLLAGALGIPIGVSQRIARLGCLGMGLVFAARTIGDFRLVGIFKRVRNSRFSYWDDRVFTPLCGALAVATLMVARG